ncbi:hypothetical protein C0995_010577 [Termitomyces sp. Mi166|nr:hypothetical protein C0995_010577 [Termitomyces sp. Mi166\
MGITPQFAHVNAIHIHELTEPLMLQLGTVGSRAVVQFGVEVKIKMLGHLTKENAMVDDGDEKLAPMASLPANSPAILMSEEEFQGTLERGNGPDQPISVGRKVLKQPDKAHLPKKICVEQVGVDLLECQLTSSRVKVEDLITDEVEEQQSAWAYNPCMLPEWNEVVASMVVHNRAGLCQPTGEVYRQPAADEISEPLHILFNGQSLKVKSVQWSMELMVSKPPVRLRTEDTGEVQLRALREQFKPTVQLRQKRMDKGKVKTQGRSDNDIPQLRQAWQHEFVDIVNRTKEELPPWRKVNHEINLIDENKQYKYHLPRCPRALQEQLHEKMNWYINAKWWKPQTAMQAAPLLCIPKKDGML